MTGDESPFRPLSGATLGLDFGASPPEPDTDTPFDVPPSERYTLGGLLGRGGMGEIRSAHDAALGRSVALKSPCSTDPAAVHSLISEATLTARLAHPGIIPLYDAGRTRDGRPFYTMPIMRGRSLADAAANAPLERRLQLIRHFLDACEAVAYAHNEGILHRDLKPSNILVGQFGETVVVDWGLAGAVLESTGTPGSKILGTVGTRPYMAPEQARGEPLTPAADVYALGVTLQELLTGYQALGSTNPQRWAGIPAELVAIAERAMRPDAADRYPNAGALAEDIAAWFEGRRVQAHSYTLRELIARAWSTHRLPITAALLGILGIVLATAIGFRRTAIEHDRAREAERAAVEARQRSDSHLALAEVAGALDAMAKEEWAEAEILAASALVYRESPDARGVLARFDSRARPHLLQRIPLPTCSRLAVSRAGERVACQEGETLHIIDPGTVTPGIETSPQGVLKKATSDHVLPWRRGEEIAFAGSGSTLLISRLTPGVEVFRPDTGDSTLLPYPGTPERLFSTNQEGIAAWLGGSSESWGDLTTGRLHRTSFCRTLTGSLPAASTFRPDGFPLLVCHDGTVVGVERTISDLYSPQPNQPLPSAQNPLPHIGSSDQARAIAQVDPTLGTPILISVSEPDGQFAAIGVAGGTVVVVDLNAGRVIRTLLNGKGNPLDLAMSGNRLAISDGQGTITVWDVPSGTRVTQISARGAKIRWLDDGQTLRVVTHVIEDWRLPLKPPWPHLHPYLQPDGSPVEPRGAGVSALALSPDGLHVLSAHGNGRVRLLRLDQTDPIAEIPLHWSVVKDVEFSQDGTHAAAICAQSQSLYMINIAQLEQWGLSSAVPDIQPFIQPPEPLQPSTSPVTILPGASGTRVAWLTGDLLLFAPYAGGLRGWHQVMRHPIPIELSGSRLPDMESDADRRSVTARDTKGHVLRIDASQNPSLRVMTERPTSTGIAGSPTLMALVDGVTLELLTPGGLSRQVPLMDGAGTDVALSPDGTLIAVGHMGGVISIWSSVTLERLAVLTGHASRVSALAFDPTGGWLISGSWDGDVRTWSMDSLDQSPETLLEQASKAWGRTLEDVLYARTGGVE